MIYRSCSNVLDCQVGDSVVSSGKKKGRSLFSLGSSGEVENNSINPLKGCRHQLRCTIHLSEKESPTERIVDLFTFNLVR